MIRPMLLSAGKTIPCGLAFYAGTILGRLMVGLAGLAAPTVPPGSDAATLGFYVLVGGSIIAGVLAFVSPGLSGSCVSRWLILTFLSWFAYSVTAYLEASIFAISYE